MFRLTILYTSLIIFFNIQIFSQEILECFTQIPGGVTLQQAASGNLSLYKRTTNTPPIRLAVHIVRYSNGSGGITPTELEYKITQLNYYMAQAMFSFYKFSEDYIDNDYFAYIDTYQKANQLRTINYKPGCINVYFVPAADFYGLSSFSSRIQDPNLYAEDGIIIRNDAHKTTFPHEVGHYFDLFHTYETYFGIENIARSGSCVNCSISGDLLCDTPADPSGRVTFSLINNDCQWDPVKQPPADGCGQRNYSPLTNNLMITEVKHCRNSFTENQKNRMNETLIIYRSELLKHSVYLENNVLNFNAGGTLFVGNTTVNSGGYAFVNTGIYNVGTNNERFNDYMQTGSKFKHNNWNDDYSDFLLKREIIIHDNSPQIAKFNELKVAVIRNRWELLNFNDTKPIWFNDPWYVKDQYNNQSGMGDFLSFPSPYSPTGKYNESSGGVFLNQGEDWQPPYYSVKADYVQNIPLQQTGRTHKFYFQRWDASPVGSATFQNANALETAVVFKQENATVQANLKGTQLSNNPNAYSKGSQRKFIRITNGRLFSVYESMGNIYLERSTDNGASWEIFNENNQIKFNDSSAHSPAIDFYYHTGMGDVIVITFVEELNQYFSRVVVVFLLDNNITTSKILSKQEVDLVYKGQFGYGNPAIACAGGGKLIVAFKGANLNTGTEGIIYRRGKISRVPVEDGTQRWEFNWVEQYANDLPVVQNSNSNSVNPTIAEDRNTAGISYQLAWEQSGAIRYCKLVEDANGNITQTSHSVISNGSSYIFHSSPSIIAIGTGARVCWLGWNDEDPVVSAVVFKDPANSRFWSFGNNVSKPNINKSNDNTYYAFGWSQNNSTVKFADNSLKNIYEIIGITGKDVQISNGNGKTNMFANIFKAASQPYFFTMSNNLNYYYSPHKSNGMLVSSGRTGVIRKNGGEVYFALGDITVNNQKVEFVECSPETDISNISELNQYLETEPFEVTDNSGFEYTVQYGIVDTLLSSGMFGQGEQVRFKVELIDNNSGDLLGVFDDVVYDQNNLTDFENILYQVNTQGIGQRTIKLRLKVEENINPVVSMVDRIDNEGALAKGKRKELKYEGETIPKEFALNQNYPNPFNPTTVISWQSPVGSHQTLKVYDILGNEIVTLVDEYREAGRYKVEFNVGQTNSLSSGVYIYKLTAGSFTSSKKMMVIK